VKTLSTLVALVAPLVTLAASPLPLPPVRPTPSLTTPMAKLSFMRGIWAGHASGSTREGVHYSVRQTERMGTMLGGDVVVIEGRGYNADNSTGFNAFAVVSWNPYTDKYEMRSYAQGFAGTFELKLTPGGYTWEIPSGPHAIVRFTATVTKDTWHEMGEYVAEGAAPVKNFEMTLKRTGDTDWPLGTPVAPEVGP
jgi:hypothetical protein